VHDLGRFARRDEARRGAASAPYGLGDGAMLEAPLGSADAAPKQPSLPALSERRLQEFLEAEVTHFAAMRRKALTLADLLHAAETPRRAAIRVHQEIPKHFAARLRQIEELENWTDDPELADIHARYSESFREMRMTEVEDDLAAFTETVQRLKERQKSVLKLVGRSLKSRKQDMDGTFRTIWLDKFLQSRICTEMLTSQYIAIVNQASKGVHPLTGIVQPECDPAVICRGAAESARALCFKHMGIKPVVEIEVRSRRSHAFSYIPLYLHYILLEVFKNSCNATAMSPTSLSSINDPMDKPITVVICSDDHRVAIRISDRAGGIPFDVGEKIWDFGFTGNSAAGDSEAAPTSLAGFGLGLPLARLYARYLGGSLSVVSLPEYGVDTYLFLPRIGVDSFH